MPEAEDRSYTGEAGGRDRRMLSNSPGRSEIWAGSCVLGVTELFCGDVGLLRRSGFYPSPVALGKSPDLSEFPCSLRSSQEPREIL